MQAGARRSKPHRAAACWRSSRRSGSCRDGAAAADTVIGNELEAKRDQLARRIAGAARRARLRPGRLDPATAALRAVERRKHESPVERDDSRALSQVLPDHTYVTEMRVEGDKLRLVGVTRDAPSLIGLIERSGRFTRATFFAPTTRSPTDPGERFHIEAQIDSSLRRAHDDQPPDRSPSGALSGRRGSGILALVGALVASAMAASPISANGAQRRSVRRDAGAARGATPGSRRDLPTRARPPPDRRSSKARPLRSRARRCCSGWPARSTRVGGSVLSSQIECRVCSPRTVT